MKEPLLLNLSNLNHTWLIDLDGTLVKHNGYKDDGYDSFLVGAEEFINGIDENDMIIILTSRSEEYREKTEFFLRDNNIRYDYIIFNVPYGERIVINDNKPSGLITALSIPKLRDEAISINVSIDS